MCGLNKWPVKVVYETHRANLCKHCHTILVFETKTTFSKKTVKKLNCFLNWIFPTQLIFANALQYKVYESQ